MPFLDAGALRIPMIMLVLGEQKNAKPSPSRERAPTIRGVGRGIPDEAKGKQGKCTQAHSQGCHPQRLVVI